MSSPPHPPRPMALIAEDEPLLAAALQAELARLWPDLQVLASVGDGHSAVAQALALRPDVLFFDIRMPGLSGLDAAAALADAWDTATPGAKPFPALVVVTAYEQYAVQAFETQAVDYLLKPVQPERLKKTIQKLQQSLASKGSAATDFEATMSQLRGLLEMSSSPLSAANPAPTWLQHIQASVGNAIHLVPLPEVLYLEAADKYVRVLTADREYLIRTPLKELLPQLDPVQFWQIHRGTVVNSGSIELASRDEQGRLSLSLRGRPERLAVSRLFAGQFKAM
ncbi:MAG: response regulator transcription factor [Rhodoferax sp.]|nr:response regulator transcription factor [Rhodoferax sp.]